MVSRRVRVAQGIKAQLQGLEIKGSPEWSFEEFLEWLKANNGVMDDLSMKIIVDEGGMTDLMERYNYVRDIGLVQSNGTIDPDKFVEIFKDRLPEFYERFLKSDIGSSADRGYGQLPSTHSKVLRSEKTREKLERWFGARGIPVQINFYEWSPDFWEAREGSPEGTPGRITFDLYTGNQDPPTAWIITHNLSHALFDPPANWERMPSDTRRERRRRGQLEDHILMKLAQTDSKITTRAKDKLTSDIEAVHELFSQWVSSGSVKLDPPNPEFEQEIASIFRQEVDKAAQSGEVVSQHDFV